MSLLHDYFAIRVFGTHKQARWFHSWGIREPLTVHVVHRWTYSLMLGERGEVGFRPTELDELLPVVGLPRPKMYRAEGAAAKELGILVSCVEWKSISPQTPHADEVGYWRVLNGVWTFYLRHDWLWFMYSPVKE